MSRRIYACSAHSERSVLESNSDHTSFTDDHESKWELGRIDSDTCVNWEQYGLGSDQGESPPDCQPCQKPLDSPEGGYVSKTCFWAV